MNPPIGFWPEYLRAVVDKIGKFYGVDIRIKWNLFSKSSDIMDSVKSGESDMTDMYMILSSFYSGKDRIEAFSVTCSPGGYESTISTLRSFNVNSITELNNFLVTSDNTKIGALSAADFNTVKPFLNARAGARDLRVGGRDAPEDAEQRDRGGNHLLQPRRDGRNCYL